MKSLSRLLKRRHIVARGWFLVFPMLLFLSVSCFHSGYENVRLVQNEDGLIFYPDQNAPRAPMPLNISASFAGAGERWGILFYAPYRETGFSAINRTIITCALYITILDSSLKEQIKRPLLLHHAEGHYAAAIRETGDGFVVAFITRDNRLVALLFDASRPEKVKSRFQLDDASLIVRGNSLRTGIPLAFDSDSLYLLSLDKIPVILQLKNDGSLRKYPMVRESGFEGGMTASDLLVDETGIHAAWAKSGRGKASTVLFNYIHYAHDGKEIVRQPIPVQGDVSQPISIALQRTGSGIGMLIQYGNAIWMGRREVTRSKKMHVEKLLSIGTSKYPPLVDGTFHGEDCLVITHERAGAYIHSRTKGRKKSDYPGYIQAVKCSAAGCIQFNSERGIAPLWRKSR